MSTVTGEYYACLEAQDSSGIASFEWQVFNLVGSESMPHACILRVNQRGGPTHFYGDGSSGDLHVYVQRGGSSDLKYQAVLFQSSEAGGIDSQGIGRRRELEKLIIALSVALRRLAESHGGVRAGKRPARNDCAFGVVDRSAQ